MADLLEEEGMLSPYGVLDLTDETGNFCSKLLGDLGADVIKIERPGGAGARRLGPFYEDEPDPEKSLFWFAYNSNKRGITLDIEAADGREIFRKLVKTADIVVESFPPGYMADLQLDYPALARVNPRCIMVSITPFGQTGPYRDFKTSDIVAFAMGGRMYPVGDADRAPVRISYHSQAYLHAGGDAAVGAMLALYHREMTGQGQHVDVSIQASVAQLLQSASLWDAIRYFPRRGGVSRRTVRSAILAHTWPCKDGYVIWIYWGGGPLARRFNMPLIEWMEEEGVDVDFLRELDWEHCNLQELTPDDIRRIREPTARFFAQRTRTELLAGAAERHAMLCPVSRIEDVLQSPQLASRQFWVDVEHPELGVSIKYPGAFAKFAEKSPRIRRRAPLPGEHNLEIYVGEMGLTTEEMALLKQTGVI